MDIESDCAAMKVVISDFCKQWIFIQQDFDMLDGKLNDLKTEAKASRVKRLELLTKIKDIATNPHPYYMWHLIKESIELEMQKKDIILYLATVTIKILEYEIYALKIRFNNPEMKVGGNLCESFYDADCTSLQKLQFQVIDPRGSFSK